MRAGRTFVVDAPQDLRYISPKFAIVSKLDSLKEAEMRKR
jgi:hypothetical protein